MRPPLFSSPVPLNQEYHNKSTKEWEARARCDSMTNSQYFCFRLRLLECVWGKGDNSLLSFSWLQPRKPVDKNAKSHIVEERDR